MPTHTLCNVWISRIDFLHKSFLHLGALLCLISKQTVKDTFGVGETMSVLVQTGESF